jgi:hypothetical protein
MSEFMSMKPISACRSCSRKICAHPAEITKMSAKATVINLCIDDFDIRTILCVGLRTSRIGSVAQHDSHWVKNPPGGYDE